MSNLTMKATGLIIHSTNKYELRGTPLGGGHLTQIKITKDTNGPPPNHGKAEGSVASPNATSADISQASIEVWNELLNALMSFPFKATVVCDSDTHVADLSFGPVPSSAHADIGQDVHTLLQLVQSVVAVQYPDLKLPPPDTFEADTSAKLSHVEELAPPGSKRQAS
jgi:hypothetical protein